jgi:hypothetical protein
LCPMLQNIQCVLHDTLLALLAGQWHFAVLLASNRLHGRWRAGCATHQTGALRDGCGRLCARGGNEGGIGDTEGLESGGRSRCCCCCCQSLGRGEGSVARDLDIPRSAMAVACLVVENMAAIVDVCVAGGRVESGEARQEGAVEVVSMIRV